MPLQINETQIRKDEGTRRWSWIKKTRKGNPGFRKKSNPIKDRSVRYRWDQSLLLDWPEFKFTDFVPYDPDFDFDWADFLSWPSGYPWGFQWWMWRWFGTQWKEWAEAGIRFPSWEFPNGVTVFQVPIGLPPLELPSQADLPEGFDLEEVPSSKLATVCEQSSLATVTIQCQGGQVNAFTTENTPVYVSITDVWKRYHHVRVFRRQFYNYGKARSEVESCGPITEFVEFTYYAGEIKWEKTVDYAWQLGGKPGFGPFYKQEPVPNGWSCFTRPITALQVECYYELTSTKLRMFVKVGSNPAVLLEELDLYQTIWVPPVPEVPEQIINIPGSTSFYIEYSSTLTWRQKVRYFVEPMFGGELIETTFGDWPVLAADVPPTAPFSTPSAQFGLPWRWPIICNPAETEWDQRYVSGFNTWGSTPPRGTITTWNGSTAYIEDPFTNSDGYHDYVNDSQIGAYGLVFDLIGRSEYKFSIAGVLGANVVYSLISLRGVRSASGVTNTGELKSRVVPPQTIIIPGTPGVPGYELTINLVTPLGVNVEGNTASLYYRNQDSIPKERNWSFTEDSGEFLSEFTLSEEELEAALEDAQDETELPGTDDSPITPDTFVSSAEVVVVDPDGNETVVYTEDAEGDESIWLDCKMVASPQETSQRDHLYAVRAEVFETVDQGSLDVGLFGSHTCYAPDAVQNAVRPGTNQRTALETQCWEDELDAALAEQAAGFQERQDQQNKKAQEIDRRNAQRDGNYNLLRSLLPDLSDADFAQLTDRMDPSSLTDPLALLANGGKTQGVRPPVQTEFDTSAHPLAPDAPIPLKQKDFPYSYRCTCSDFSDAAANEKGDGEFRTWNRTDIPVLSNGQRACKHVLKVMTMRGEVDEKDIPNDLPLEE